MSIKSSDLFIYKAINAAIDDIRKSDYVLDDILGDAVTDPLLSTIYGQKEVDKFRRFMKNKIQVDMAYNIDTAKVPAIAISLEEGTEDTSKTGDALGDGFQQQQIDPGTTYGVFKPVQVILGPVTPIAYDSITGTVTFPTNVSLKSVFDGQILYDEKNKVSYPIQVVLDDQTLMIEVGSEPDLDGITIRAPKNVVSNTVRSYFFHEKVVLTCMATETAELIYLFSLIMYIIGRYRITLFDIKNFEAATVSYGKVYKAIEDPQQIFARDITMTGRIENSYIEATTNILQGVSPDIKIGGMPQSPPGLQKQAQAQGWDSPEDPD
jgi:hypothetical protein